VLQVVAVVAVLALLGAAVVVRDHQLTSELVGLVPVG
jgi:hypothetical protein